MRIPNHQNLIYFGNRNYDPFIGRWVEPDPLGFIDSINLYQYNFNNRYVYFDPEGLAATLGICSSSLARRSGHQRFFGSLLLRAVRTYRVGIGIGTLAYTGYKVYEAYKEKHLPVPVTLPEKAAKRGISNKDADTLIEWGKEYDFPNTRDDRGAPHWEARDGMDHIHLGPKHIPVID